MAKAWPFLLGMALILAVESIATEQRKLEREDPSAAIRKLELLVVERGTNRPLAGITIASPSYRDGAKEYRSTTDRLGRITVPIPPREARSRSIEIHGWKDGYVPVRICWLERANGPGVPTAYTLILDPGTPIGGIVCDEQGHPVAGARVFPSIHGRRNEIESVGLPPDVGFESDAKGQWRCAILPAHRERKELHLRVEHPRFVSTRRLYDRRLAINDLRAMKGRIVLQTGFTLSGTVADERGRAVTGATVILWDSDDDAGADLLSMDMQTEGGLDAEDPARGIRQKTGTDGHFRFENCARGVAMLTVELAGMAPAVKQVRLGPSDDPEPVPFPPPDADDPHFTVDATQLAKNGPCAPPLEFRVAAGRTIRGRVIHPDGNPVASANVIPGIRCAGFDQLGWRGKTDADGRFVWTNAPDEALTLNVGDPAEGRSVERVVRRDEADVVVTLPIPFRVHGRVFDAETGLPIEHFRLIPGRGLLNDISTGATAPDDDGRPDWDLDSAGDRMNGQYEERFPGTAIVPPESCFLVLRIEAKGYARAVSRKFRVDEGDVPYDFSLQKRPWIRGTVHSAEGSPIAGAEVCLAIAGEPELWFDGGHPSANWQGDRIWTGPDGTFAFPAPEGPGRLVAVNDLGLAVRSVREFAANSTITLAPWGRINGRLRIGPEPGVNQLIGATVSSVGMQGGPRVGFNVQTETDAEGNFDLERVAPGRETVFRPHRFSDGAFMRSQRVPVEVISGQTASVTIGGSGRAVVGRVAVENGSEPIELAQIEGRLRVGQSSRYAIEVANEGSFRVEDVLPGEYSLTFEYKVLWAELFAESGPKHSANVRARCRQSVQIPPGPERVPLDVGVVTLERVDEPANQP